MSAPVPEVFTPFKRRCNSLWRRFVGVVPGSAGVDLTVDHYVVVIGGALPMTASGLVDDFRNSDFTESAGK